MLNSYEINKETIAIVPINNNNSKVLEEENTININKNSSMIIVVFLEVHIWVDMKEQKVY